MNIWLIWFALAVVFAIIEIVTAGFFIICFGVGALAAMIVALLTSNLIIQFSTFMIVSIILLFVVSKFTPKITKDKVIATNVDAVIGKIGIVTTQIPALDNPGIVKVSGEIWSAISYNSKPIEEGSQVKVLEVRGVRLIVQKLD